MNEDTVKKNLDKMTTPEYGGMLDLLLEESMGGNAGYFKMNGRIYSCVGANFFYDGETGEIKIFTNYQDFEPEKGVRYAEGLFRLAVNLRNTPGVYKILERYYHNSPTWEALDNLEMTILIYNREFGFKL